MKKPDIHKMAEHYAAILQELSADIRSEGMRKTPLPAAKALVEMTEGSRMETDRLTTMFKAECQTAVCHDMVIVEGIKEAQGYDLPPQEPTKADAESMNDVTEDDTPTGPGNTISENGHRASFAIQ